MKDAELVVSGVLEKGKKVGAAVSCMWVSHRQEWWKLVKSSPRPDEGPCPDRASSEQLSFDVPRYLGFFDLYLQTQLWALSSLSPLGSVECGCRPLGHNTEARGLHQAKQGMRIPPRFWRVVMVERKNLNV